MDDSFDNKQGMMSLEVDADWYRETYPDVAQAGIDPVQHYQLHGRAEGRFPHPLQSLRLEQALWGGFSQRALPELRRLYESTANAEEQSYAAWALTRWYASNHAWNDALPFAGVLKGPLPPFLNHPGSVLLGVEVLLRTGHIEDARCWLRSAMTEEPALPDWALAAANARLPRDREYADEDNLRLAWLISVWQGAGLAAVEKRNLNAPLGLDNLRPLYSHPHRPEHQPKISVLMPAFNASEWIGTALQGLLDQTWNNMEIIVIDDVSSDDTVARVMKLANRDPRIILLQQQENQGAYAARNLGLQHATGEFVTNHDSDDWSHPERLERMVQPLLEDSDFVATLANWVRVDSNLHFQTWRAERSLVEPSVATLMCRRQALVQLGGWDTVRVAADWELYRRLQHAYGKHSVHQVLAGFPLVLARQLPKSLTTAVATHLRTMFFGIRRLYQELFETWHALATAPNELCLLPLKRAFPAPAVMLHNNTEHSSYDWVIMADLSVTAPFCNTTQALIQRGLAAGKSLALFHWPAFHKLAPTHSFYLKQAVEGRLEIILSDEATSTNRLFIVDEMLLSAPPDRLPKIHFDHCQAISESHGSALDGILNNNNVGQVSITDDLLPQPCEFDSAWYLHHNPDVRVAGIDPWRHYVANGAAEGREPGPNFNTLHYLNQCSDVEKEDCPPLLHYLRIGKALGHDPRHPELPGLRPHIKGRPTLLLCAHAVGGHLFGAERCFLDVVGACHALSINVLVSVPSIANSTYIKALQANVHKIFCVPTTIWQADVPPCPHAITRLKEIIISENVDIVQANTSMLREPLVAGKQAGVITLLHIHEIPEYDPDMCRLVGMEAEQIRKYVLRQADHLLVNSELTASYYEVTDRSHLLTNVVNISKFDIPNDPPMGCLSVGLISSNEPKKGLNDFLQLAQILSDRGASIELKLIGPENEHTASVRRAIKKGEVPSGLRVLGYRETPESAIAECNVVLNLSHCQETFGRTVLEAIAARRPVVGYRWGALPELIKDGENGFLLPLGDVLGVASRLETLRSNKALLAALGEAGRRLATTYSMASLSKQLDALYTGVLFKTSKNRF